MNTMKTIAAFVIGLVFVVPTGWAMGRRLGGFRCCRCSFRTAS